MTLHLEPLGNFIALERVVDAERAHLPDGRIGVDLGGVHEVSGTERAGQPLLVGIGVAGEDRVRPRDGGGLEHVEADAANADNGDALARRHLGPVEHCSGTGQDPTPDERGGRHRYLLGDSDRLVGLDDDAFAERRDVGEVVVGFAIERERGATRTERGAAHGGPPAVACRTGTALRFIIIYF